MNKIKLTEPIKLNNRPLATLTCDTFSRGIIGNYDQLSSNVGEKDLIHLVTQPPEFFFAEGDATNIFNQKIDVTNIHEKKLEVINSLINRITLTDSKSLTYQDKVYISNILRKLGIKNESQFISQIYKNLEETKNISSTVNKLNSITEVIKNSYNSETKTINERDESFIVSTLKKIGITDTQTFIENVTNRVENQIENRKITNNIEATTMVLNKNNFVEQAEEQEDGETQILNELLTRTDYQPHFYQQILRKLGIEENVSTLRQLQMGPFITNNLTKKELELSNYSRIVNENNLTEAKYMGTVPITLDYKQENIYESQTDLTEITEEEINSQLTSAVLFSLIQNVSNARINRGESWSNEWINVNNSIYQSAGESITRFEENIKAPIDQQFYVQQLDQQIIDEITQIEINNQERVKLFEKAKKEQINEARKQERARVASEKRDAKKDSLMALQNPQAFMEKVAKEQEQAEQLKQQTIIQRTENLPPAIKARMDLLQAVVKQGEGVPLDAEDAIAITQVLNEIRNQRNQLDVQNIVNNENRVTNVETTVNNVTNQVNQLPGEVRKIVEAAGIPNPQVHMGEDAINLFEQEIQQINLVHNVGQNVEITNDTIEENSSRLVNNNVVRNDSTQVVNNQVEFDSVNLIHNTTSTENRTDIERTEAELNEITRSTSLTQNQLTNLIQSHVNQNQERRVSENETINQAVNLVHNLTTATDINETSNEQRLITSNSQNSTIITEENAADIIHKQVKKAAPRIVNETTEQMARINLVHKETNEVNTEEIIERLVEEKRILQETKTVNEEHHTIVNQEINEEHTRKIVQNEIENINIVEVVQSSVQRELNDIEGEIFSKLESKLESEQMRRGIF